MSPPTKSSIMLVNGRYFDHLAPDPSVIDIDVLEHGLQAPRFNNQTIRPISIAEHSLRVRRIAVELAAGWKPSEIQDAEVWALLHDAHEALVPWGDCLRPGKTDAHRKVEDEIDVFVVTSIARWPCTPPDAVLSIVKTADNIALYFEAMLWAPGAIDWAPGLIDDDLLRHAGPEMTVGLFIERFMPLIAPRPGEDWRTEVEKLIGVSP